MTDFILQTKKHSTMLSIWTEELHCHVDKDGEITLSVSKTDSELTEWLPELNGINTPHEFSCAIKFLVDEWGGSWTLDEVVDVLVEHYPSFGKRVKSLTHKQKSNDKKQYPKCMASEEEHRKFAKEFESKLIIGVGRCSHKI